MLILTELMLGSFRSLSRLWGWCVLTLWQASLWFCSIVYSLCSAGNTLSWLHAVLFLIFLTSHVNLPHPDQLGQGPILISLVEVVQVSVAGQALRLPMFSAPLLFQPCSETHTADRGCSSRLRHGMHR